MHESRTHGRTDKLTGQSRIGSLSAPPSTTFAPARSSTRASALRLRRRDRRRRRPLPRFPFFSTPPAPTQSFPGARERNVNVRARVRARGPKSSDQIRQEESRTASKCTHSTLTSIHIRRALQRGRHTTPSRYRRRPQLLPPNLFRGASRRPMCSNKTGNGRDCVGHFGNHVDNRAAGGGGGPGRHGEPPG